MINKIVKVLSNIDARLGKVIRSMTKTKNMKKIKKRLKSRNKE